MSGRWFLDRGATPLPDGSAHFAVWAPRAERVSVQLPGARAGRAGGGKEHPLARGAGHLFEAVVPGVGVGTDYLFRLDGGRALADPVSRHQPGGVHGASRVDDPRSFAWTDAAWIGPELADLAIYELHVGTFTREGTFDGVGAGLPYLGDLGITAIELMPVAEFPGARNWGYDGVFPYAAQSTYGGPEGLRRLVDSAHARGIAVLLDVVYNHLGPEGSVLPEYGPYLSDRHATPWGPAINYDGPGSEGVRRYFLDNALSWITDYHLDGLRLDAVQAIHDTSAVGFLEELVEAVHRQAAALGRRVLVVAECDRNEPRLVRSPQRGGSGCDAEWNDDLHHAVHAALTGERRGSYADFGGIRSVARALGERFVLDGRYSVYRQRRHGAPAADLAPDKFVAYIQNHDRIGNRAGGERLASLVPAGAQKLAAAILLLSPYVPLLFMGEEWGETAPFLYFVSHSDPSLREAVRRARQQEASTFGWTGAPPDPASEEAFERSRLGPGFIPPGGRRELVALYRDLLRLRREEPALHAGGAAVRVRCEPELEWIALHYAHHHHRDLIAAFNFASEAQLVTVDEGRAEWRLRFSTGDPRYGGEGPGADLARTVRGGPFRLSVPAGSAVLYRAETG